MPTIKIFYEVDEFSKDYKRIRNKINNFEDKKDIRENNKEEYQRFLEDLIKEYSTSNIYGFECQALENDIEWFRKEYSENFREPIIKFVRRKEKSNQPFVPIILNVKNFNKTKFQKLKKGIEKLVEDLNQQKPL